MSYFLSDNLLADLALSAKASKILSRLIVNNNQSEKLLKITPIATASLHKFFTQRGLYFSIAIWRAIDSSARSSINPPIKVPNSGLKSTLDERPFVRIRSQSNSEELSLDNKSEREESLITQLTNSNLKTDLVDWNIWIDERGYLYFQPTPEALRSWLKILFDRAAAQDSKFSVAGDITASTDFLHYIDMRCSQMWQLAARQINPWVQGELNCTQMAELELIYGIIQVYDSLYMGAKHQILAASKSLGEKFLEFDRTCRLLNLDPNSPAFHERAGLIAIGRSAIRDLLANQAIQ